MVESKTQFCLKLSDKMFSVSLNYDKRNKQLKVFASIWCSDRRITAGSGETAHGSFIFFSFNRSVIVCFFKGFYVSFKYNLIVRISCDPKIKPIKHWCSLMQILFFIVVFLDVCCIYILTAFISLDSHLVQLFPRLVLWGYCFILFKN